MNYYYQPSYGEQSQQSSDSYYRVTSEDYEVKIRQQPRDALLAQDGKEKARKPIDPPPIVEITVREAADPIRQYLQSPYLYMTASLVPSDTQYPDATLAIDRGLCGAVVSSLHKLKDNESKDGGFFVFGDVSVKKVGEHRLLFSLFELQKNSGEVTWHKSILSDVFTVHPQKEYPGLEESTNLSRTFADQGVRLRLRKESRTMGGNANRKRSFPFGSQASSQVGSAAGSVARSTMSYHSGQVPGSSYSQLSRSPSKRQRTDDTPYGGYAMPPGPSPAGFTGLSEPYSPAASARLQSHPQNRGNNRWSMYGAPPVSTPETSSDMFSRSSSLPRLDPSLAGQQAGVMSQQGLPPGSAPTPMNPSAAPFQPQAQQFSYGNTAVPGGYATYNQQYPTDGRYAPQPNMYGTEHGAMGQQYSDPSQGYQGGYDNTSGNRSSYHIPSTRGWS